MLTHMTAGWMIDELAFAGPEHLDDDFVTGYDRKQGYPDVEGELDLLRELGALTAEATTLDLGAGTGRFAVAAAPFCKRVVAVDVSEAMVSHLRRRVEALSLSNVDCVHAGFLSYQHNGTPVAAVFCRNALHQLPDFWKGVALWRMSRWLRVGGILRLHDLVYDFSPGEGEGVLERWMEAASDDAASGYTREDFETHVRTEFSTYSWLLEPLLERAGFEIVDVDVRMQVYASYTCVRR